MRATSPSSHSGQSTPASSSQRFDASVSRQNVLNLGNSPLKQPDRPEDSGPVIYESASRAPSSSESSRGVPVFTTPPPRELSRSTRSIVHDLHSTPTHSPARLFDAPSQTSPKFHDPASTHRLAQPGAGDTIAGETAKLRAMPNSNTSDSSGRPSSRGHSSSNTSRRGPPRHQPPQQPPPQVFEPPISYASLQDLPRGFSAQYLQSGAQSGQRGPLVTPPSHYPLSSGPRIQLGSTPYAYPSHPGLHAQDASMHPQTQLHGYFTGALAPVIHPHYSYTPGQSPWEVPSSSAGMGHSYFGSSVGPTVQALYPTSHALTPFHAASQPITPPYSVQWSYAPRYSTPQFVYSPTTLAPPNNSPNQTPYSYEQPYRSPTSALPGSDTSHDQGSWWYLPPGTRPVPLPRHDSYSPQPYAMHGSVQTTRQIDPHGHTLQSSSPSVVLPPDPVVPPRIPSPLQQQLPSINSPPLTKQQSAPNPSPSPPLNFNPRPITRSLSEPARLQATHSPSISSGASLARPPSSSRKPYHPSPPANRSEWVMWVGNVPSDATQDELLKFFSQDHYYAGSVASAGPAPPEFGTPAELPFPSSSLPYSANVSPGPSSSGVQSIFLISKSQCAFVNYVSEQHLHAAISRFNGQRLHSRNVHGPVLICRVRAREDDLKTGVGAQRGAGVHSKWVKEQRAKAKAVGAAGSSEVRSMLEHDVATSSGSYLVGTAPSNISRLLNLDSAGVAGTVAGGNTRRKLVSGMKTASTRSDSSESYASTNSSMLMRHFPKRYFILKSLSQFDLDLSVERGLWATQKHNEVILDQAYRTSRDVYLIFGVNKSGEFYGYARMAGLIYKVHDEQGSDRRVSWGSRLSIESPPPWRAATGGPSISLSPRRPTMPYLLSSDGPRYEESPLPMNEPKEAFPASKLSKPDLHSKSAPAVMLGPHNPLRTASTGPRHGGRSFEPILPAAPSMVQQPQARIEGFRLDPKALERAVKQRLGKEDSTGVRRWDAVPGMSGTLPSVPVVDGEHGGEPVSVVSKGKGKAREGDDEQGRDEKEEGAEVATPMGEDRRGWGEPFRTEWIKTTRLPFRRTRHLRNPWNHDREIKVSRDGTELEPSVGQALLDEWDKPELPPPIQLPGRIRARINLPDAAQTKEGGPG